MKTSPRSCSTSRHRSCLVTMLGTLRSTFRSIQSHHYCITHKQSVLSSRARIDNQGLSAWLHSYAEAAVYVRAIHHSYCDYSQPPQLAQQTTQHHVTSYRNPSPRSFINHRYRIGRLDIPNECSSASHRPWSLKNARRSPRLQKSLPPS